MTEDHAVHLQLPAAVTYVPAPELKNLVERQARLTKMKRIATGLLVFVTVLFIVTRVLEETYPWLGPIRAMSEAAMVGALADWFAVTALFRHPMGIPIPHTAIVPNRKDRIGLSLGGFVQNNFLSRELIASKLQAIGVSRRIAEWLKEPANARKVSTHASKALAGTVQVLRDDDVQDLLDRSVIARIRATRVAPVVGNALGLITASNRHQELLDEALKLLDRVVDQNDEIIRERIRKESPWWLPGAVDDRIHDKIVTSIENLLHAVSSDPNHPLRARFDAAVDRFVERLKTSPEVIAKGEELKEELLAHPSVRQFSAEVWTDAKAAIVKYSEQPEDDEVRPIERGVVSLGETMLEDPELLAKVDGWLLDATLYVVEQYRTEVGQFIAETVRGWDPEDTSRKIELAVGRDLQFIRINGTIMGALVGLLLYMIGLAL